MATRQGPGGISPVRPQENDLELQQLGEYAINTHNSLAVRAAPHSRDAWVLVSNATKRNHYLYVHAMSLHVVLSRWYSHRFMSETVLFAQVWVYGSYDKMVYVRTSARYSAWMRSWRLLFIYAAMVCRTRELQTLTYSSSLLQNAALEFVKVVEAKQQVVAGMVYYLTIEATSGGRKGYYDAKVWVKAWENFKQLEEFTSKGPLVSAADLGVNNWRGISLFLSL